MGEYGTRTAVACAREGLTQDIEVASVLESQRCDDRRVTGMPLGDPAIVKPTDADLVTCSAVNDLTDLVGSAICEASAPGWGCWRLLAVGDRVGDERSRRCGV
jgi:hypothetical protein